MKNWAKSTIVVLGVLVLVCGAAQAAPLPGATARDADVDNNHFLFGPAVGTSVIPSGSYAGIGTYVNDNATDPGDFVGTTALLMAGTNTGSGNAIVTFAWRNRTELERWGMNPIFGSMPQNNMDQFYMDGGGSSRSGVALALDEYNVISDVADIQGVVGPYVLQMDYDETLIMHGHFPELTYEELEPLFKSLGKIYLGWLETDGRPTTGPDATPGNPQLADYDEWCNAVVGNIGTATVLPENVYANFDGSWDDFVLAHPDAAADPGKYLGSWGADITDNTVWAVLDHNSIFAVVPEPGTMALLVLGGAAVVLRRRRKLA